MGSKSWEDAKKYLGRYNSPPSAHARWNEYMRHREATLIPAIIAYSKAKRANPDTPTWDPYNFAFGAEITQKMINHYSASTEEEVADVCARISRSHGENLRTGVPGSKNMPVHKFYEATSFPGTRYHQPRWGTVEPERPAVSPPKPGPPPKQPAMTPFPMRKAYEPVEPRSSEWREACKMDLKFHQQELLDNASSFLQAVWEASVVENGLSRLLIPEQHRSAPEAIMMAYRWATTRLHPDKFPADSWERAIGWQIVATWHSKTLFLAQKAEFMAKNNCPDWNHFEENCFPKEFTHRSTYYKDKASQYELGVYPHWFKTDLDKSVFGITSSSRIRSTGPSLPCATCTKRWSCRRLGWEVSATKWRCEPIESSRCP